MVDGPVRKHLEVLGGAHRRRVGVLLVEGVRHAHPFDWLLRDAVDHDRRRNARRFEERRHDVDDVVELGSDAARILDVVGPGDCHALPRSAEVRRHLLGPFERRVKRP